MPIVSFGRCANCHCSGVQRGDGWSAVALPWVDADPHSSLTPMRLVLTVRGTDVIDLELRWPTMQSDEPDPPKLEAAAGGEFERAEPMEVPDTTVRFGFTC